MKTVSERFKAQARGVTDVPVTFNEVFFLLHHSHMAAQAASLPFSEGHGGGGAASSLHTAQSQGL